MFDPLNISIFTFCTENLRGLDGIAYDAHTMHARFTAAFQMCYLSQKDNFKIWVQRYKVCVMMIVLLLMMMTMHVVHHKQ